MSCHIDIAAGYKTGGLFAGKGQRIFHLTRDTAVRKAFKQRFASRIDVYKRQLSDVAKEVHADIT